MIRIWLYVVGLNILALGMLSHNLANPLPHHLIWGLVIAGVSIWAEMKPLSIREKGSLTLSGLLHILALVFLGLPVTLIGVLLAEVTFGIVTRRPLVKVMFNAGQTIISVGLAHWAFIQVGGQDGTLTIHALVLALVYLLVNTLLVASILSLVQRQPLWDTWIALNRDTLAYNIILSTGGLAFGGLILSYNWLGLVMVGVLILCLHAVLTQASLSLGTMKMRFVNSITVLITALEYRDPYTYGHSSRVAAWCKKVATELDLPPHEIELIEIGGLLHDVGKVGVPDFVLTKPNSLTCDEYEQIKVHPLIGERIILGMKGMEGVQQLAIMARQHHIHFNGDAAGYPQGEEPGKLYLGSRILSVADAWDAMTSDRPYRKALSPVEALVNIQEGRGTQFDPAVVDAFIDILMREQIVAQGTAESGGRSPDHVQKAI
jgi:HD-GYP domain-containing protein (c-di-GMP phosphodiesterase class II)